MGDAARWHASGGGRLIGGGMVVIIVARSDGADGGYGEGLPSGVRERRIITWRSKASSDATRRRVGGFR